MTDKPTEEWMQKASDDFEAWIRDEAKRRALAACQYDYGERELLEAFSAAMRVAIARALMAADKAATERAASWHDNQAVEIEMSSKRVNGKMMTRKPLWHRQCASAIRKGAPHD